MEELLLDEKGGQKKSQIDSRKWLTASAMIGVVENAIFYPFEYLKTRQQTLDVSHSHHFALQQPSLSRQPSLISQVKQTLKTSGPKGLYRGFSWFASANVPADMIYLYGYAMSKQTLLNTQFGSQHPTIVHMLSGAMGDFFSIVLVVPLEIVAQVNTFISLVSFHL